MKLITLALLTLATIFLGACAHNEPAPASTSASMTSTHGYSK